METGYKVVTKTYKSAMVIGEYSVLYTPGTVVISPPNTLGLMFFDTLYNARAFSTYYGTTLKILEIEFDKSDLLPKSIICNSAGSNMLKWFYSSYSISDILQKNFGLALLLTKIPPKGTLFAKQLTVTYNER